MATMPVLVSLEEYLHTSYRPDVDYISGGLEERNVGEYDHGKIQGLIFHIFTVNGKLWGTDPVVEQRIRVEQDRVRVCDVAVLRVDAPREKVTVTPPLICIEVLSPEDRHSRSKLVLADYWKMGVRNVWLIDPLRRTAFIFDGSQLIEADPTNLNVPNTPIRLDLTEAFTAID